MDIGTKTECDYLQVASDKEIKAIIKDGKI
jgi:hypothetical protein